MKNPGTRERSSRGACLILLLAASVFASGCGLLGSDDDDDSSLAAALALLSSGGSSTTTQIVMFSDANSNAGYNGNLGGRAGADAKCLAAKPSTASCTTVHAWLSIASGDAISDMPTTYGVPTTVPIVGPGGTTIAVNWSGLLDGTVSDAGTLQAAGLFAGRNTPYYWTGSNANSGTAGTSTCSGFTNSASGMGHALDSTNNSGFVATEDQNCNSQVDMGFQPMSIVCICY